HASGVAEVLFTDVVNWQNGWTFWNPVDARGQQIAYRRFEGGLQNHFGQTTGTVFLDVQRVTAVSEEAGKPSTQAGTGTVVFYISLNQDGLIRIGVK
ncbi:MAG: hypothetical protein KDM64_14960, partial [Verrucomicrobiae bacterium]|nr:hypothetical protein [Verrucomicrobiae bacterium]